MNHVTLSIESHRYCCKAALVSACLCFYFVVGLIARATGRTDVSSVNTAVQRSELFSSSSSGARHIHWELYWVGLSIGIDHIDDAYGRTSVQDQGLISSELRISCHWMPTDPVLRLHSPPLPLLNVCIMLSFLGHCLLCMHSDI